MGSLNPLLISHIREINLGFLLSCLDLITLTSFIIWTLLQKGTKARVYLFEFLQLGLTASWMFLVAITSNNDDMVPMIVITLRVFNCMLHFLYFFGQFLYYFHFN